jgi:hypothetical protein
MLLWQAGAVFDEIYDLKHLLHKLLDNDAEKAILVVYQFYKATQEDAKALLHLMHGDEYQAFMAVKVLVWLMINDGA